jgi:hypothetical protein
LISDAETTGGEVLNRDENNEEGEGGEEQETNVGELSDCPNGHGVDKETEKACAEVEGLRLTKCESENKNEEEEEVNPDEQISPQGKGTHLHLESAHDAHSITSGMRIALTYLIEKCHILYMQYNRH